VELLPDALAAQHGQDRAAALAPEVEALIDFGARAPDLYRDALPRAEAHHAAAPGIDDAGGRDVVYGDIDGAEDANRTLGSSYYEVDLHTASISGTAGLGRHSATWVWSWNGYWASAVDFANHGRAASAMGVDCTLSYRAVTGNPEWTATTCRTHYDALSNGGGHNCHDDSRNQMNNFVYDSYNNGWERWCADGDSSKDISSWPGDQWANDPSCSSSSSHGYNY
jgi:hypothetical protein